MPYIMNALDEDVKAQAHGKWWDWKPNQIKQIHNEKLAAFLAQHRGEDGLVEIQDSVMEMDKTSAAFKEIINEKRKEGIAKVIAKQNFVIRNLEMSLRRDYETSGQKGNYLFEASKGELAAYKKLKKYKEFEQEQKLNVADEIQKIREDLFGDKKEEAPASSARPSPLKASE